MNETKQIDTNHYDNTARIQKQQQTHQYTKTKQGITKNKLDRHHNIERTTTEWTQQHRQTKRGPLGGDKMDHYKWIIRRWNFTFHGGI